MRAPTLRHIQQLYPLGGIEFDDLANRELNVVLQFRHQFVRFIAGFQEQITTDRINELILADNEKRERDSDGEVRVTQEEHDKRVFRFVSQVMDDVDSIMPGVDVMFADNNFKAQKLATETINDRVGGLFNIGMVVGGGGSPQVPFSQLQCAVHSVVHWMFWNIVGAFLYRMHPEIRFPVHRVVEFNVDVPDGSNRVQAIITGYNTKLLLALQADEKFVAPDTTEGLFDD